MTLSPGIKQELDFHIQVAFGDSSFVQQTKWATPDWTVINFLNKEVASFYNIVEREIKFGNKVLKVAGINSVITSEKYRGKGFATYMLQETQHFLFNELHSDAGLLLCADSLVPFYERMNWYKVDCPVYIDQPDGKRLWQANTMMLFKGTKERSPSEIDLKGRHPKLI